MPLSSKDINQLKTDCADANFLAVENFFAVNGNLVGFSTLNINMIWTIAELNADIRLGKLALKVVEIFFKTCANDNYIKLIEDWLSINSNFCFVGFSPSSGVKDALKLINAPEKSPLHSLMEVVFPLVESWCRNQSLGVNCASFLESRLFSWLYLSSVSEIQTPLREWFQCPENFASVKTSDIEAVLGQELDSDALFDLVIAIFIMLTNDKKTDSEKSHAIYKWLFEDDDGKNILLFQKIVSLVPRRLHDQEPLAEFIKISKETCEKSNKEAIQKFVELSANKTDADKESFNNLLTLDPALARWMILDPVLLGNACIEVKTTVKKIADGAKNVGKSVKAAFSPDRTRSSSTQSETVDASRNRINSVASNSSDGHDEVDSMQPGSKDTRFLIPLSLACQGKSEVEIRQFAIQAARNLVFYKEGEQADNWTRIQTVIETFHNKLTPTKTSDVNLLFFLYAFEQEINRLLLIEVLQVNTRESVDEFCSNERSMPLCATTPDRDSLGSLNSEEENSFKTPNRNNLSVSVQVASGKNFSKSSRAFTLAVLPEVNSGAADLLSSDEQREVRLVSVSGDSLLEDLKDSEMPEKAESANETHFELWLKEKKDVEKDKRAFDGWLKIVQAQYNSHINVARGIFLFSQNPFDPKNHQEILDCFSDVDFPDYDYKKVPGIVNWTSEQWEMVGNALNSRPDDKNRKQYFCSFELSAENSYELIKKLYSDRTADPTADKDIFIKESLSNAFLPQDEYFWDLVINYMLQTKDEWTVEQIETIFSNAIIKTELKKEKLKDLMVKLNMVSAALLNRVWPSSVGQTDKRASNEFLPFTPVKPLQSLRSLFGGKTPVGVAATSLTPHPSQSNLLGRFDKSLLENYFVERFETFKDDDDLAMDIALLKLYPYGFEEAMKIIFERFSSIPTESQLKPTLFFAALILKVIENGDNVEFFYCVSVGKYLETFYPEASTEAADKKRIIRLYAAFKKTSEKSEEEKKFNDARNQFFIESFLATDDVFKTNILDEISLKLDLDSKKAFLMGICSKANQFPLSVLKDLFSKLGVTARTAGFTSVKQALLQHINVFPDVSVGSADAEVANSVNRILDFIFEICPLSDDSIWSSLDVEEIKRFKPTFFKNLFNSDGLHKSNVTYLLDYFREHGVQLDGKKNLGDVATQTAFQKAINDKKIRLLGFLSVNDFQASTVTNDQWNKNFSYLEQIFKAVGEAFFWQKCAQEFSLFTWKDIEYLISKVAAEDEHIRGTDFFKAFIVNWMNNELKKELIPKSLLQIVTEKKTSSPNNDVDLKQIKYLNLSKISGEAKKKGLNNVPLDSAGSTQILLYDSQLIKVAKSELDFFELYNAEHNKNSDEWDKDFFKSLEIILGFPISESYDKIRLAFNLEPQRAFDACVRNDFIKILITKFDRSEQKEEVIKILRMLFMTNPVKLFAELSSPASRISQWYFVVETLGLQDFLENESFKDKSERRKKRNDSTQNATTGQNNNARTKSVDWLVEPTQENLTTKVSSADWNELRDYYDAHAFEWSLQKKLIPFINEDASFDEPNGSRKEPNERNETQKSLEQVNAENALLRLKHNQPYDSLSWWKKLWIKKPTSAPSPLVAEFKLEDSVNFLHEINRDKPEALFDGVGLHSKKTSDISTLVTRVIQCQPLRAKPLANIKLSQTPKADLTRELAKWKTTYWPSWFPIFKTPGLMEQLQKSTKNSANSTRIKIKESLILLVNPSVKLVLNNEQNGLELLKEVRDIFEELHAHKLLDDALLKELSSSCSRDLLSSQVEALDTAITDNSSNVNVLNWLNAELKDAQQKLCGPSPNSHFGIQHEITTGLNEKESLSFQQRNLSRSNSAASLEEWKNSRRVSSDSCTSSFISQQGHIDSKGDYNQVGQSDADNHFSRVNSTSSMSTVAFS